MFSHPLVLSIVAICLGIAAGLGSFVAARSAQGPSAQAAKASAPDPSYYGIKGAHAPKLPVPGSHLAFNATFTGSTLNTQMWSTCYWYVPAGSGCGHFGVYSENEWYLPSQDVVSGGALHLVASAIPTVGTNAQGQAQTYPCRSGVVTTDPSFSFTYGYVQVVARMPKDPNAWPALWMLPINHASDLPEIDIAESLGTQTNRPGVTYHPSVGPTQGLVVKTHDLSTGWHTFGLNWEPGSITWYIDGVAVFAVTNNVPNQPMFFLANLAITDAYQPLQLPSSCTTSLSIRSVKIWQK